MIASPNDIGKIIQFLVKNSKYFNGSRIPLCCGLHLDYKNLPSVGK